MAWQSQSPDPPPQHYQGRSPNTSRGIAWLAIFLSLVAIGVSTFVFLSTYDEGRFGKKLRERGGQLKENIQTLKDETAKALKSRNEGEGAGNADAEAKGGDGATATGDAKIPADAKPGDSAQGEVRWDRIQERLKRLRTMVSDNDDRAGEYLDKLKSDLSALRDYSTERGSALLEKAMAELQDVRENLETNAGDATKKLKSLSEEIAPKAEAEAEKARSEPAAEGEDAEPETEAPDPDASGADKPAKAKKAEPEEDPLPDLPPPPEPAP